MAGYDIQPNSQVFLLQGEVISSPTPVLVDRSGMYGRSLATQIARVFFFFFFSFHLFFFRGKGLVIYVEMW